MNGGERVWEDHWLHTMTAQMARDEDYHLALDEEIPLDDPYGGRATQTHIMLSSERRTQEGESVHDPLDLPFPEGEEEGMPFIHIMFDEDTIAFEQAEGPQ